MVVTVPKTRIFRYNKYSRKIRGVSRFYKLLAVPLRGSIFRSKQGCLASGLDDEPPTEALRRSYGGCCYDILLFVKRKYRISIFDDRGQGLAQGLAWVTVQARLDGYQTPLKATFSEKRKRKLAIRSTHMWLVKALDPVRVAR